MGQKSLHTAIIVTAAIVYPQASVFAQTAHMFSGTVSTTAVTAECDSVAEVHAQQALFRPHLSASDPKAAIILGADGPIGGYGQLQDQSPTKRNMNGTGSYDGTFIDPQSGQLFTWSGTYSLAVTPTVVGVGTIYVYATGTISNFANVANCTMTINAAFIQPVASN